MTAAVLKRVVVVGNGIAGLTAADTLRECGFDGELTVVGAESHAAYSRPALSKAVLADRADAAPAAHALPPASHGAAEILGVRATGLDLVRRRVTLDGGETLPYDGLVLATGSRARRLSALPDELTLRGLDDALALRTRLAARPSVLVVGGGALGMELASGCVAAGCRVTLVARGVPLTGLLGPHLAGVLTASARAQGLTVVECGTARVEGRPGDARVVLDDGRELRAELLLSAVGDVPATDWLAGTGLVVDGAVPVDAHGLARPGVAAVGDLAAVRTPQGVRRVPLWSSAVDQAKAAATALVRGADDAPPFAHRPYFWTEAFGHSLKAAGHLPAPGTPTYESGEPGGAPALLTWRQADGTGTAVALDHRIAVPRLRRLAQAAA